MRLVLWIAALGAIGCGAAPPPPRVQPCPEPRAGAVVPPVPPEDPAVRIVVSLHGSGSEATYASFGEGFRKAVSREKMKSLLAEIATSAGAFRRAELVDRTALGDGLTRVLVLAAYERGAVACTLITDKDGVVQGLSFDPIGPAPAAAEATTGPADDYVAHRAYALPGRGAWVVGHGGRSRKTNHHVGNKHQWYAFDLVQRGPDKRSFKTDGKTNEDFLAWGQPVVAPADGTVAAVVDGVADNPPGEKDNYFVPGNLVVIDHGDGEHSFLAHFQRGTIVVRAGAKVKKGQVLGKVGNSGNTSEPHIHWHLGTDARMQKGHGLPIRLEPLLVNGTRVEAPDPVRGDVVEETKKP